MAYLNLDPDFLNHPKTIRLLGETGPEGVVCLLRLWCFCAKFAPNGDLSRYSASAIEKEIMQWHSEPEKLLITLQKMHFIEDKQQGQKRGYFVHDWKKHQGHILKLRERARRNAAKRWGKIAPPQKRQKRSRAGSDAGSSATGNAPYRPVPPVQSLPSLPSSPVPLTKTDKADSLINLKPEDLKALGQEIAALPLPVEKCLFHATHFACGFVGDGGQMPSVEYLRDELRHLIGKVRENAGKVKPKNEQAFYGEYLRTAIDNFHKERAPIR